MSKRNNVAYIKPADPKFLQQLKAQIGFNSGPNIDTKRQRLDTDSGSESDRDDEAPQVVVLKRGDLTAEEAQQEQERIETDDIEKPADLTQRIVFKSKNSVGEVATTTIESESKKNVKKPPARPTINKQKLSFQVEDDDDSTE